MIELKKSQLEPTLLTISTYDLKTNKLIDGLLKENITLGVKRKLQKIHKETFKAYKEFLEDVNVIKLQFEGNISKQEEEFKILLEEVVKLDVEPIQFSNIENVSSESNYNLEIIEKITI